MASHASGSPNAWQGAFHQSGCSACKAWRSATRRGHSGQSRGGSVSAMGLTGNIAAGYGGGVGKHSYLIALGGNLAYLKLERARAALAVTPGTTTSTTFATLRALGGPAPKVALRTLGGDPGRVRGVGASEVS